MDGEKETSGIFISEKELDRRIKTTNRNLYISLIALLFAVSAFIVTVIYFVKCV
ncbi:hypothetical protein [Virgibacillus oceani]|uniref:Uncharacterized protein n=1 Tax=Virgibacillus oceani TaxID=1479511 RepID=A0A917LXM4_9BACI|nr:hypothetical protein [Virgibacillus oceani]GGG64489.1 hypothetical protein GCM10011398_05100 [Virgibacillus oceani]